MMKLKQYKVNTGNTGAYYLNIPPEFVRTFGITKGQRLFAYIKEDDLIYRRSSASSGDLFIRYYNVQKSGERGLKITLPSIFANAKNISLESYLNASMTKEGDLLYSLEQKPTVYGKESNLITS